MEQDVLPDFQHFFLSQKQHFKTGMLKSNGCFQLRCLLHLAPGGRQDSANICELNIAFISVSAWSTSVTVMTWSHD